MSRFSRTVSSVSSVSCCGHDAEAAADLRTLGRGIHAHDRAASPSVIGETHPIIRIVEVLPAPFGPRNPNDSPGATSKSMASTAVKSPNRLVRPRAWMSGGDRRGSRAWAGMVLEAGWPGGRAHNVLQRGNM